MKNAKTNTNEIQTLCLYFINKGEYERDRNYMFILW